MESTYNDRIISKEITEVQEMMADFEKQQGKADRIFCFMGLINYIINSAEAQRYLQSEPELDRRLRIYTDEYMCDQIHLYSLLFTFSDLLARLGF